MTKLNTNCRNENHFKHMVKEKENNSQQTLQK